MASSRRLADDTRPGLTAPVESQVRSVTTTSTSTQQATPAAPHPHPSLAPQQQLATGSSSTGYSEFHLAPATRTSVVTTTTTTTVHFAPILLPRTKPIQPSYSSFSHRPPLTPKSTFANFIEAEEARAQAAGGGGDDALRLDPKVYPLSQVGFPGGVRRFRMELGGLEGVFYEDGRQAAVERVEREEREQREALEVEDAGLTSSRRDKGKGRAVPTTAALSRSERGPLHQRRAARRPRSAHGGSMSGAGVAAGTPIDEEEEEDDDMLELAEDGFSSSRISPGPPRKRPRTNSHSQASLRSVSVESEQAAPPPLLSSGGALGPTSAAATAATLPSPNMSPPSPVPTFAGEDSQEDKKEEGEDAMIDEAAQHQQQQQDDLSHPQLDLGSGQALSGLLSLPDFVNTFDQLSPALQSYFIFTFLKRSSIPVLQAINNIVTPALRRDFLTDLPPELGVHILGFLDAKALCRASVVCKGWRRLADGEWRVWKERLVKDELWVGDGSEEREAKEIVSGSKENLFLKRWRAGVWDQPVSRRFVVEASD